jgi:AcrR family transcriptional regulator
LLVDAATRLIQTRGHLATSLGEVLRATGVGKGIV